MVTMPDGSEKTFNAKGAPFNFFAGTDYSTQIRIAMRFVQDKGGHKVAFAYCTGSTFCTEPIPAGKTFAKEINLAIGPDFNPELADNAQVIDDKMKAYAGPRTAARSQPAARNGAARSPPTRCQSLAECPVVGGEAETASARALPPERQLRRQHRLPVAPLGEQARGGGRVQRTRVSV